MVRVFVPTALLAEVVQIIAVHQLQDVAVLHVCGDVSALGTRACGDALPDRSASTGGSSKCCGGDSSDMQGTSKEAGVLGSNGMQGGGLCMARGTEAAGGVCLASSDAWESHGDHDCACEPPHLVAAHGGGGSAHGIVAGSADVGGRASDDHLRSDRDVHPLCEQFLIGDQLEKPARKLKAFVSDESATTATTSSWLSSCGPSSGPLADSEPGDEIYDTAPEVHCGVSDGEVRASIPELIESFNMALGRLMEAQAQANAAKDACVQSPRHESQAHAAEAEARVMFAFADLEALRDALQCLVASGSH